MSVYSPPLGVWSRPQKTVDLGAEQALNLCPGPRRILEKPKQHTKTIHMKQDPGIREGVAKFQGFP